MELGLFGNLSANGFNYSTTLIGVIESNLRQQLSNITSGRYHATMYIDYNLLYSLKKKKHIPIDRWVFFLEKKFFLAGTVGLMCMGICFFFEVI